MEAVQQALSRAAAVAASAAEHLSSSLSTIAASLSSPSPPARPPSPPYTGPDRLSPLSHDLHALIFTFLPLRALFVAARVSSTFRSLPSHPVADELYRSQLFVPSAPSACTDRRADESWREYVTRVVAVERRLVGSEESGLRYEIGGCDERVRGPRMYCGMRAAAVANYTPTDTRYWEFVLSPDSVFGSWLMLNAVCWLQVERAIALPCPPAGHSPFRFRLLYRLGVSERSNLGSPTFSAAPVPADARFCSDVRRVVHNDELVRLIRQQPSRVMGVGEEKAEEDEQQQPQQEEQTADAGIGQPVWDGEQAAGEQPRGLAMAEVRQTPAARLLGHTVAFIGRNGRVRVQRRYRAAERRDGGIRPEMVLRELVIGEIEVRARDSSDASLPPARDGKEEKREAAVQGEEEEDNEEKDDAVRHAAAGAGPDYGPAGFVRVEVKCLRCTAQEGWKSGVAFDCIIAERIN